MKMPILKGEILAEETHYETRPWYRVPHLIRLNLTICSLFMWSGAMGYEGSVMNGLMSLQQWQSFMNYPTSTWLGFINAIAVLSGLFCYPVQAWVSDTFGRKPCLYIAILLSLVGVGIQASAHNDTLYIVGRVFVGATAAWGGIASVLIAEIAYPTHRPIVTTLFLCQYYVGSIIAAWVTFGVRNMDSSWAWRIPSILQLAIPFLALPGSFFTPESPRWLVSKGRLDEARAILVKHHGAGDVTHPLVDFEMREIEHAVALEKEAVSATSYLDAIRTPGNRHRLLITLTVPFFAQWVGNGVLSFYLSLILQTVGITSVTQQTLLNGFLNVWNLLLAIGAATLIDKAGRRKLFLLSCSIMLFAYVVFTALSGTFAKNQVKSVGIAAIPFLFILCVAYVVEIWPNVMRARGVAMCMMMTNAALTFNIFVNPIALDAIAWKYYLVFVAVIIAALFTVYFAYPETAGLSLEQIRILFDGDEDVAREAQAEEAKRETHTAHVEAA
ncbi:sugar transporter [Aspergillus keveii]|uniref:Sugar transporter n=1 Tax=Aspergillus keveii TaxID=714993 RepID=A0ABR4FMS4_9EURO